MLDPFSYVAPRAKAELLARLADGAGQVRLLAGGTDVLPDLRLSRRYPRVMLDLKRVTELRELRFDTKEGLRIGAAVTCADLLASAEVRELFPVLALAAGHVGSPQLRNRATAVGNICTASPCADVASALLAHGAQVEIESKGGARSVSLADFFVGPKKTALAPDELVTRVVVPSAMAGARGGMQKLKRIKGHDLALASVVLVEHRDELRLAIGSCAPTPVPVPVVKASASKDEVLAAARSVLRPIDDLRASAEYRSFMVAVFIERLLATRRH